jgi:hypothetical protein
MNVPGGLCAVRRITSQEIDRMIEKPFEHC